MRKEAGGEVTRDVTPCLLGSQSGIRVVGGVGWGEVVGGVANQVRNVRLERTTSRLSASLMEESCRRHSLHGDCTPQQAR